MSLFHVQTLLHNFPLSNSPKFNSAHTCNHRKPSIPITKFQSLKCTNNFSNGTKSAQIPENDAQELELLNKPYPATANNGSLSELQNESQKDAKERALKPFLKFLKDGYNDDDEDSEFVEQKSVSEDVNKVRVEYYEAKKGDFVVGVVVSGNENKIDVNVGAEFLGVMLSKEVLPFYGREMENLLCDFKGGGVGEIVVNGRMGVVKDEDAMIVGRGGGGSGRPVVEVGTVLFAEVLGRTLSGRPLLSCRRLFRRVAWHRVRQIKQLNQPIEVKITEWNTGGLLARIEGLRAFLPKAELFNRVRSFGELKQNVGRRINVLITRIDEDKNDLILSERQAWELLYLQEGTLLEGFVYKILPYGAQIRIAETNRSGLLHISNITRARVTSMGDLLAVNEKVKVLVVKSAFPGKISLSTADLESEPGLFLSNKEKVFLEAEEMAKKYRKKLPVVSVTGNLENPLDALPFNNEARSYANWEWFKFERDCDKDQ